jgi:hypothetical protein
VYIANAEATNNERGERDRRDLAAPHRRHERRPVADGDRDADAARRERLARIREHQLHERSTVKVDRGAALSVPANQVTPVAASSEPDLLRGRADQPTSPQPISAQPVTRSGSQRPGRSHP